MSDTRTERRINGGTDKPSFREARMYLLTGDKLRDNGKGCVIEAVERKRVMEKVWEKS